MTAHREDDFVSSDGRRWCYYGVTAARRPPTLSPPVNSPRSPSSPCLRVAVSATTHLRPSDAEWAGPCRRHVQHNDLRRATLGERTQAGL